MSDIIQLLPDSVANQIAAGEVVQRPASVAKELIENSIDAGADSIVVIVKEAGKSLLQVIDNGCGMGPIDARMAFERHATSKIRKTEDLFSIRTMGFRGEALASIAAVAQVELKTRRTEDEVGTRVCIEVLPNNKINVQQDVVACETGTSIAVRNLFFNIPARRNFLKSNSIEMRHIIDEFQRLALMHPYISFTLIKDGQDMFRLPKGNLKQRILHLFGNNYNERIAPVEEGTPEIKIKGFIGKPEFAKKTRGEQFFFVNSRFVRDNYLNHAVISAYNELLPLGVYPFYIINIDIDPVHIDINIHPTKTEVKFDNERDIYAILRSAIMHSLGMFNLSPSIDFDISQEAAQVNDVSPSSISSAISGNISFHTDFNPFEEEKTNADKDKKSFSTFSAKKVGSSSAPQNWSSLYQIIKEDERSNPSAGHPLFSLGAAPNESKNTPQLEVKSETLAFQIHNKYILSPIKSGFILIDQQAAHERILFERYQYQLSHQAVNSQQCMFPKVIHLSPSDFLLVQDIMTDLKHLGFSLRASGKTSFIIEGLPDDLKAGDNEVAELEQLIELFKQNIEDTKKVKKDSLAQSLAQKSAIKSGVSLSKETMNLIIDQLFACSQPKIGLNGQPTFTTIGLDEIARRFNQ